MMDDLQQYGWTPNLDYSTMTVSEIHEMKTKVRSEFMMRKNECDKMKRKMHEIAKCKRLLENAYTKKLEAICQNRGEMNVNTSIRKLKEQEKKNENGEISIEEAKMPVGEFSQWNSTSNKKRIAPDAGQRDNEEEEMEEEI